MMILFTALLFATLVIAGLLAILLIVGGSVTIVVFGDIIVFGIIMYLIIRHLWRNRKKRWALHGLFFLRRMYRSYNEINFQAKRKEIFKNDRGNEERNWKEAS